MPYADPEKQKAYDREKYLRNRDKVKARTKARYWNNLEAQREWHSQYGKRNRKKISARVKKWRKTQSAESKAAYKKVTDAWRAKNGDRLREKAKKYGRRNLKKLKARTFVHQAVKWGLITKPNECEQCGRQQGIQAHHLSYDPPLRIKWLCHPCHVSAHLTS